MSISLSTIFGLVIQQTLIINHFLLSLTAYFIVLLVLIFVSMFVSILVVIQILLVKVITRYSRLLLTIIVILSWNCLYCFSLNFIIVSLFSLVTGHFLKNRTISILNIWTSIYAISVPLSDPPLLLYPRLLCYCSIILSLLYLTLLFITPFLLLSYSSIHLILIHLMIFGGQCNCIFISSEFCAF